MGDEGDGDTHTSRCEHAKRIPVLDRSAQAVVGQRVDLDKPVDEGIRAYRRGGHQEREGNGTRTLAGGHDEQSRSAGQVQQRALRLENRIRRRDRPER
jgi:hypothetical protein